MINSPSILSATVENSNSEKLVTTKELAQILNVDVSTVQKSIKRIQTTSDVLPKFGKGQTPKFNEEQATLIKQEIQKHHNLANRQIDSVSTELEEAELVEKAFMLLSKKVASLQTEKSILELQIKELTPDAETWRTFAEKSGNYCTTNVAKLLKLQPKTLFNLMKTKGWICRDLRSGDWSATVEGITRDYVVNELWCRNDKSGYQMRITPKGMQRLQQMFSTTLTADSFIEKGEKEEQKIISETADKWIEANKINRWFKAE